MRRTLVLALLLSTLPVLPDPGAIGGENGARIEPAAGILWNDRVDDVHRKLAAVADIRRIDISLLFNDTVTGNAFGPTAIAPGSDNELRAAVSSLVLEYLAGVEADRAKGGGSLAKAFDLHCAGVLADKAGGRKDYLDVVLRMAAKPVPVKGAPFELTAEFRAHPGAGLTKRYSFPVPGTKYLLPVVLTKVTLAPASPPAAQKFPEIAEALKTEFARFRGCAAGASDGWCDDRQVSVSFVQHAGRPAAIRYDAETFWSRGLDMMYKDHVRTLNGGKSCRCHAPPARDAVY